MEISVSTNARSLSTVLRDVARRQIPYAAARAVNDLAFQVQRAEAAGIKETFRNPRPFTARSTLVDRGSKQTPVATVSIRPEVAKYLQPYEFGGLHVLPGRALLDPKDIALDQYGQLPKGIMAKLQARKDIYIGAIQTKAGPIKGVWQRLQVTRGGNTRRRSAAGTVFHPELGRLRLLIRFGDALPVNKRLQFHARAIALIQSAAPATFANALAKAIASAR